MNDIHRFLLNSIAVVKADIEEQRNSTWTAGYDCSTPSENREWRSRLCLLRRLEDEINAHRAREQAQS